MWATFSLLAVVDEVVFSAQPASSRVQVKAAMASGACLGIRVPECRAYGIGAYGDQRVSRWGRASGRCVFAARVQLHSAASRRIRSTGRRRVKRGEIGMPLKLSTVSKEGQAYVRPSGEGQ
ncbi:hypothetical protein GCM10009548_38970 [Streptomyces malaysiensis subsp. malaysiensis]